MLKHLLRGGSDIKGDSWVVFLHSGYYDIGRSVAIAQDGSVYACGEIDGDIILAKFSSSGTLQWQKTFNGRGACYGRSVAVAQDGSVYVCGEIAADIILAKFSSSGTLQWQKKLNGSYDNGCHSIAVAQDGSVYVCGYTDSSNAIGSSDLLLVKFSSSGTLQWQKKLGGSKHDQGISVAVASDGSVYVCGETYSAGAGNRDLLLAKFSSSGTLQWQKTLGGSKYDYGLSVAVAPDGSVYVCGATDLSDTINTSLLLVKFSSSGTVQWQKTLGGSNSTYSYSVAVAPDGSVYVCGHIYYGNTDLLLAKFSSSGTLQWQKKLDGSVNDDGYSVAVAPDGSVYVCGETDSVDFDARDNDFLLAKITDSLIEKDTVTFGSFTFQDTSLTSNNVSLTIASNNLSVSNAGLTVTTTSLNMTTPSLTTDFYPL